MSSPLNARGRTALAIVLAVGVGCRFAMSLLGENFDLSLYYVQANLMNGAAPLYSTRWYNYAPLWAWIVHIADLLSRDNPWRFRMILLGVLTAADVGIAAAMLRIRGPLVAALFFLNPVSIHITGFHHQFDNLATAAGLWACVFLEEAERTGDRKRDWWGMGLLGLSLVAKHFLFFLPVWLALRRGRRRWAMCAIPYVVFAASFLPYIDQWRGMVANVVGYGGYRNAPMFLLFLPFLKGLVDPKVIWLVALSVAGWATIRTRLTTAVFVYLAVGVIFAPAMANQYLAIPMPFCVVYRNYGTLAYTIAATVHLLSEEADLLDYPDANYVMSLCLLATGAAIAWLRCRAQPPGDDRA